MKKIEETGPEASLLLRLENLNQPVKQIVKGGQWRRSWVSLIV